MTVTPDAAIICSPKWHLAMYTARMLPRPDRGRLYMVTFEKFFKIGSSKRVYERFNEVIQARRKYVGAIIGAETPDYIKVEKMLHLHLTEWRYYNKHEFTHTREYYERSPQIEAALFEWFRLGSPSDISLIEKAVSADDEPADSAVPCCWKCGAPQRV